MTWIPPVNRRTFLATAATAAGGLLCPITEAAGERAIRVGVIGLGGQGSRHLATYGRLKNVIITAICDADERRVRQAASTAVALGSNPQRFGNARALLESGLVEAVSIATPDYLHAPLATLACRAGTHVLVESPSAHSLPDVTRLVRAAASSRVIAADALHADSFDAANEVVARVDRGAIGTVRRAEVVCGRCPRRSSENDLPGWPWVWSLGSGALALTALEQLDVARRALRVAIPTEVCCVSDGSPDGGLIHAESIFVPRQGPAKVLTIRRSAGAEHPHVRIVGDQGTLVFARSEPVYTVGTARINPVQAVAAFARRVRMPDAEPSLTTIVDGALTSGLLTVINAAARLRRPVSLDAAGHPVHDDEAEALIWPERREQWVF